MSTRTVEPFDPQAPGFLEDPYTVYRRLREHDPVHRSSITGNWVVSRHEDVGFVLRDDRFSAERERANTAPRTGIMQGGGPRSMLRADPPDHTRLRHLVNKAFTARTVERLRPRIVELVDELCNRAEQQGELDFIADFAYPLPITVIAEMLGVPADDHDRFREWSYAIAVALGPQLTEDAGKRAMQAGAELGQLFTEIIEQRRIEPRDDLTSALLAAEEAGDQLSHGELRAMLFLLLIAGHETTVNLLGNGLHALLRHPDALEHLRAEPQVVKTAIEEFLRYDSPVQLTSRVALEELEIGGKRIGPLDSVTTLLGAANRDPEAFENPDRLDLTRHPNPHMSFGAGIHFCLGAPLARLEAQIAFPELLGRFSTIELVTEDLRWRPAVILRGLETLPIRVRR